MLLKINMALPTRQQGYLEDSEFMLPASRDSETGWKSVRPMEPQDPEQ